MAHRLVSEDTAEATGARVPARTAPPRRRQGARPALTPAGRWAALTSALADVLGALGDKQYLVLTRGRHYVQVAALGDGKLRVEAVSNNHLLPPHRLRRAQILSLRRLGWKRPTHTAGKENLTARERRGSPNYYVNLKGGNSHRVAARLLTATLRQVYGLGSPDELVYRAFHREGGDILLPTLGLECERHERQRAEVPMPICPSGPEELRSAVVAALRELTGSQTLKPDADGDISVSRHDVTVHLRVAKETPDVHLASLVLRGVEPTPETLEAVVAVNNELPAGTLRYEGSVAIIWLTFDAKVFVPELLVRAIAAVSGAVEHARRELQWRLGGTAALDDGGVRRPEPARVVVN